MADKNNDRDIFGPSETKPGTSGHKADSDWSVGAEPTPATHIDDEIIEQDWQHGAGTVGDLGTSHDIRDASMGVHTTSETYSNMDTHLSGESKTEQVRQKAAPVVNQAKEQASQAVEQVQDRALGMVDQQKGRAAEMLGTVAHVLHTTGEQLDEKAPPAFGQYVHKAANKVDNLSRQLNEKGVQELVRDAEGFARREPQIFLGGAVLAGILLSRFLKSSTPKPEFEAGNYGQGYTPAPQSNYGRSFERGPGSGYTARERGGIEQMDQDYNESWTGDDHYPPSAPGPIS